MQDNSKVDELRACSESSSIEKRRSAFDMFLEGTDDFRKQAMWILLDAPYRDVREAVIDWFSPDVLECDTWRDEVLSRVSSDCRGMSANLRQAVLIFLQRMTSVVRDDIVQFYTRAFDDDDSDVRYQAFVLAELREDSSEGYVERVGKWLDDSDRDFRIVAVQALSRLRPDWAFEKLSQKYASSSGEESFHILLALLKLCTEQARRDALAHDLSRFAMDDRFAFPAIEAAAEYGTPDEIPMLLDIAKSLLGEPTIRVAAAGAAAKLGSDVGRELLTKFSKSRHGNPMYAQELLAALEPQK